MNMLKEITASRREYKTKWQALNRAKKAGLDIALVESFYRKLTEHNYSLETIKEVMFYASRQGLFGFINNWEK